MTETIRVRDKDYKKLQKVKDITGLPSAEAAHLCLAFPRMDYLRDRVQHRAVQRDPELSDELSSILLRAESDSDAEDQIETELYSRISISEIELDSADELRL